MIEFKTLNEAYKTFFDSESGKYFIEQIEGLIDFNHKSAELKPENSRDHTQRAKGNREVLDAINIVLTGVKKGKEKN